MTELKVRFYHSTFLFKPFNLPVQCLFHMLICNPPTSHLVLCRISLQEHYCYNSSLRHPNHIFQYCRVDHRKYHTQLYLNHPQHIHCNQIRHNYRLDLQTFLHHIHHHQVLVEVMLLINLGMEFTWMTLTMTMIIRRKK